MTRNTRLHNVYRWTLLAVGVICLAVLGRHNYLLFHLLTEAFAITICWAAFTIAWNSRRFLRGDFLLLLGIAYAFVGVLDLFHTVTYKGMSVLPVHLASDTSAQLWVAARLLQSVSVLLAFVLINRRFREMPTLAAYGAVTGLLMLSIMVWDVFPTCYVEGRGLTTFKVFAEYAVCLILVVAAIFLYRRRNAMDPGVASYLGLSIGLTIASELFFTMYVNVYGLFNMTGHLLKVFSFYMIYRAIVVSAFEKPYATIFRHLEEKEESLRDEAARYRELFDSMWEAAAVYDVVGDAEDFVFKDWNKAAEQMDGYGRDEVIGRRLEDVVPKVVRAGLVDVLERVWRTGVSEKLPVAYYEDENTSGWRKSFVYRLPNGEVVAITTDETPLEMELHKKQQRLAGLNTLIEVAREALAAKSVPEMLQRVVDAARSLTGARIATCGHVFRRGEFATAAHSRDVTAPPCPEGEQFRTIRGGVYQELLDTAGSIRLTKAELEAHPRWKGPPEGHIPLRGLLGASLTDGQGRSRGLILLTDKERGEFTEEDQALLEQLAALASLGLQHLLSCKDVQDRARKLAAVLRFVPAAVWIGEDPDLRRITGNLFGQRLLRLDEDRNPGRAPGAGRATAPRLLFEHDGRRLEFEDLPLRVAIRENRDVTDAEFEVVHDDGTRHYLFGHATPLRDDRGKPTGAVAAFMDVSDLKMAEMQLEAAKEYLESRVEERTRELARSVEALRAEAEEHRRTAEALVEAEKQVRQMSNHVLEAQEHERRMVAQEVHDSIGAQLAAVKFSMEGMLSTTMADASEEAREGVQKAVEMMMDAVAETRRLSQNLWPTVLEDLGLIPGIRGHVRQFTTHQPELRIELDLAVREDDVPRPLKIVIYRIVQETVTNASKYAKAQQVTVRLGMAGRVLSLSVADDGVGFDPEEVTQRQGAGRGLGLSSLSERVTLSGGEFRLIAQKGHGCEVRAEWDLSAPGFMD